MFCQYCGNTVESDDVFCQFCGQKITGIQCTVSQVENVSTILKPEKIGMDLETTKQTVTFAEHNVRSKLKGNRKTTIILSSVIILLVAAILIILKQPNLLGELSGKEIAKLSNSVLTLNIYDDKGQILQTGSGFVVFDDSTLMTNFHVINGGQRIEAVSENDVHYNISGIAYCDEYADIAVLKFESPSKLPVLSIADSNNVAVGDEVYAIGSPLGLKNTVSNGIVSAIRNEGGDDDIQITAPISSGSSGGVLLNKKGKIIGITYASYADGQNINLAIPSTKFLALDTSKTIMSLSEFYTFYNQMGNSYINYSSNFINLVEYSDYIYESWNSDNRIYQINKTTGEKKELGISGTCLNAYHGVLYFIAVDSKEISAYNLSTTDLKENIFADYQASSKVVEIEKLFVTNYGITVVYSADAYSLDSSMVQLDFDGNIVGTLSGISDHCLLIEGGYFVYSDYETREILFVSLDDLKSTSVKVDFEPGAGMAYDGGDYLYIADTSRNSYCDGVKYNINTGAYDAFSKLDAGNYGIYPYNDNIYYTTESGVECMSQQGLGWDMINTMYPINGMNFTSDGKIYGFAEVYDPNSAVYNGSSIIMYKNYTKFYVCMNVDGSNLEVIDKEDLHNRILF